MRKHPLNLLLIFALLTPAAVMANNVAWIQSGFNEQKNDIINWENMPALKWEKFDGSDYRVINIDAEKTRQKFDGFGGAFNEKGWDAISALPEEKKQAIIKSLFSSDGLNLNIGRIPIGANDFSMDYYSLNDSAGDYAMKNFSIERDKKYLLPYIKAAMKYKPDMDFMASPWTPPAWMKANQHYGCRGNKADAHLIWQPENQRVYALYLSKFISAYQQEGVKIDALHLQNEPAACQDFPSSLWSGEEMRTFLRDYLIPQFEKDKQSAQAWLGTINYGDYKSYAEPTLEDPALKNKIGGIGYQWDGKYAIAETHKRYPQVKIVQTESECGKGENDIFSGFYTFSLIKTYLDNGASAYVYWNMILDASGNSTWGWKQNSLISVDRMQTTVKYNFEYYILKHFSALLKPGAEVLDIQNDESTLAFKNPNGELVIVSANPSYSEKEMRYKLNDQMFKVKLPMMTISSFVVAP
ncbi:glycosyl hydrolase [Affinibrenneria salicis]|uniref:Glycosyl hydrolase n=1 Tax=Affinibrenneria salicis TaxID=2590031 RepID=A0A5J5FWB0_9GAMM|nr:glycosyl hydrolase [Affinibrenneria salicis]KAA8998062.1 glycosyl hydrolase [Affinibrenneria salicis]